MSMNYSFYQYVRRRTSTIRFSYDSVQSDLRGIFVECYMKFLHGFEVLHDLSRPIIKYFQLFHFRGTNFCCKVWNREFVRGTHTGAEKARECRRFFEVFVRRFALVVKSSKNSIPEGELGKTRVSSTVRSSNSHQIEPSAGSHRNQLDWQLKSGEFIRKTDEKYFCFVMNFFVSEINWGSFREFPQRPGGGKGTSKGRKTSGKWIIIHRNILALFFFHFRCWREFWRRLKDHQGLKDHPGSCTIIGRRQKSSWENPEGK